jgi:anti-sigma regulatory factor (Ser/Thr protein kinase)
LDADVKKLDEVTRFLCGYMETVNFPEELHMKVLVATEEVFVNIANYAYGAQCGSVTIRCAVDVREGVGRLKIVFSDGGTPYNPLEMPDPDIGLPAEERRVGGLGVFMTKRLMDETHYSFEGGRNILTLFKFF